MKKTALITGASSGIGKELAIIHASKGGDLILVARRESQLNELKEELMANYKVKIEVIAIDLMKAHAAKILFDRIKEKKIEIEYLFNNAGLGGYGKFHDRELDLELDMIQLNIVALTELTHLFLPEMIRRKKGKILNTASTAGFLPGPMQSVYYATKAYVVSFSQGIARELNNSGVTVSALCPGPVQTGFEDAAGMSGSGLFKNAENPTSTAKKGYKGMEKGKLIIITNRTLSFTLNWIMPFAPRKFVLRSVEKLQTIKK